MFSDIIDSLEVGLEELYKLMPTEKEFKVILNKIENQEELDVVDKLLLNEIKLYCRLVKSRGEKI